MGDDCLWFFYFDAQKITLPPFLWVKLEVVENCSQECPFFGSGHAFFWRPKCFGSSCFYFNENEYTIFLCNQIDFSSPYTKI